jgi:predicted  nucleic acid-binding Zn-ribbon protein
MSDEPDNVVLHYLRRIDERTERLEGDMKDMKTRLTSVEEQVSLLRSDVVHVQHRLDKVEDRLGRIEKRLDLIDA